jgi:hypothetical protein
LNQYDQDHLLDTYVFCLSQQSRDEHDGLLSMWRGYGGNGSGAALVFDTSKIEAAEDSPFVFDKVYYGSVDERLNCLKAKIADLASILANNNVPNDALFMGAYSFFERIKLFALFSKHHGFKEEREWRIVYMNERDKEQRYKHMQHYAIGRRGGIEPKLRFKVAPIDGLTTDDFSLTKIVSSIMLGPSASSVMAYRSIRRMLELIGKSDLKDRLYASSIPFRAL